MTNVTFNFFPELWTYVQEDSPSLWDKWNLTTKFIRIWAEGLYTCNDMAKHIYTFIEPRKTAFQYSWLQFTYGFIQNILAQIFSINNVYLSMNKAVEYDDDPVIWFNFGRLFRILMVFEPIEMENPDDDWYYN